MEETKKPTETEIIRDAVRNAGKHIRTMLGKVAPTIEQAEAARDGLLLSLREMDEANEARDRSRTLSGVSITVPLYTEEHYRSVLSIGFDLGVQAFRKELDKASCCSGQCMGDCGVGDPENPFQEAPNPDH